MDSVPVFASASEAMEVACAALGYLASSDATEMAAEEQAGCLQRLERAASVVAAARASMLGAFTAGKGYSADADYSPRAWLIHKTGITRAVAVSYTAWARRAVAHPEVFAVLAAGDVSESFARTVCVWTDKLPAASRDKADAILMAAAVAGLGLPDLAVLASEMLARCWQPDQQDLPHPGPGPDPDGQPAGNGEPGGEPAGQSDDDPTDGEPGGDGSGANGGGRPDGDGLPDSGRDEMFEDRALRLLVTFGGAGVLHGDLTPECAEIVHTVLDALAVPAGPEDSRDQAQRYHDAMQEAMTRLLAAGLLPERAGQPVKAWVNISLADLMLLDGTSELLAEWTARLRGRFVAHRAASAGGGGDAGGAWLDGAAAEGLACDAILAPVVTGDVDPGVFGDLVRLCVDLDRLSHASQAGGGGTADGERGPPARRGRRPGPAAPGAHPVAGGAGAGHRRPGRRAAVRARRAGLVPAAQPARRPAGRAEPATGHRLQRHHPGLHPQRGPAPG